MSNRTLIVFIAITGTPSIETLTKMMEGYKNVGIHDVMIYPRAGLEVDYMSEGWREIMQNCIDYAKEHDMRVWLYDEFMWPSGSCHGRIFYKNDQHYRKNFYVKNGEIKVIQGGYVWDRTVDPFVGYKNNLTAICTDEKRFIRYLDAESGEVIQTLYGTDVVEDEHSPSADLLNPEAVENFIECTHQQYYEWFGSYFGTLIPGVFTDEPQTGMKPQRTKEGYTKYAYYDGICQDYRDAYGTELLEDMLLHEDNLPDNDFLKNYNNLVSKRFRESFIQSIGDWCKAHQLKFTGHLFEDDSAHDTVVAAGDVFKMLDGFDIPGVDEIYTRLTYDTSFIGLPVSCGATIDFLYAQLQNMRRHGKDEAMVELYALGPYNMSFAQRARAIWFAAAYGLTHYFVGLGHLQASGNYTRSEFFMNCSYAVWDWTGMADVAKAAEIAIPYADKTPTYTVSVRYPYSSLMNNMGKADVINYDYVMKDCIELLGKHQIQWKLIREEEIPDTDITISFGPRGILEENSQTYYQTVGELFGAISNKLTREVTVTEMSGVLAHDVFVRTYTDGSFLVINRSDDNGSERDLILHKDGKRTKFRLYDFGVYYGEEQETVNGNEELLPEHVRVDMNGNKRFLRCDFGLGNNFEFEVDSDVEVVMHACAYPDARDVYLDRKKIPCDIPETDFTDCFNSLYLKSEPVLLEGNTKPNMNRHNIVIAEQDRAYLPMVILEGDICWDVSRNEETGKTVYKLWKSSETPNPEEPIGFYKTASLHFDVDVPEDSVGAVVQVDDYHGLVEFKVNGEHVSQTGTAPYIFKIPKLYAGCEVHCELVYYSTYRALFGDVEAMEQAGTEFRGDWVKLLTPVSAKDETIHYHGLRVFAIKNANNTYKEDN